MNENNLEDLDARRVTVNRRIGVYSLWVILIGSGLALLFIGGGMGAQRRWGIFGLIVAYVAVRIAIMRYRERKKAQKTNIDEESFIE